MTESPKVTQHRTEDLTADTREAIIRLCIAAFRSDDFQRMFSYPYPDGQHLLAYHRDTLVCHAAVTTRWLQPAGVPVLKTAWVDALATSPDCQRQGYGSVVMRHLANNIPDYDIAGLKTASVTFYQRLGWECWRGPLAGRRGDGVVPTPEQRGVMVLPLRQTPSLDFDSLLTIECQPGRVW